MSIFDDSEFTLGQAGLPGTGLTAGEKTTINSRLSAIEAETIPVNIGDLADVDPTALNPGGPVSGDLLMYVSGVWVPVTPAPKTVTTGIIFPFGGAGVVIPTGIAGELRVTHACTITAWTLLADQAGSIVIDIWKDVMDNYPPTVADKITGAIKPFINNSIKGSSATAWPAINAGDCLRFNVDSASTVTRVTLILTATRSI